MNTKIKINCSKAYITGYYDYMKVDEALTFKSPNYWFSPAYKNGHWDGK